MKTSSQFLRPAGLLLTVALLMSGTACSSTPTPGVPADDQPLYGSDVDAASALLGAVKAGDHSKIRYILGSASSDLSSGDRVEDTNAFNDFARRAAQSSRLDAHDQGPTVLYVGLDNWPFPIPIAKTPLGLWFYDTASGKLEIIARRVGQNELDAIAVCHIYVKAQLQYALKDRDGDGVAEYAQHFISGPDKHNGLYWDTEPGQEPSPLAALVESATREGYGHIQGHHQPYHGYHFRILKHQGPDAPGGEHDYITHGHMTEGFALVAFPEKYGSSGVMTFIVNQHGKVHEKDLGPDTTELARNMFIYNPDSTWTPVKE